MTPPVQAVENLLLLYAGVMLLNAVLAALSWNRYRTPLHRTVFSVWAAGLFAFVLQGVASAGGHLQIVFAFSAIFMVGASIAQLIVMVTGVPFPWRAALAVLALSYPAALIMHYTTGLFPLTALPTCIAVAFPMLFVAARVLINGKWRHLSFSGKGLVLSMLAYSAHTLDFPFLRLQEQYAALGFTIAILIVFALSVFAPAVVLEIVTDQQARVSAEIEVAHRIQTEILPKRPHIHGLELACYMKPADEVGGDYYDVFVYGDHSWILLGDVTGHGLSAGLVMLMAQSVMSAILHARADITPGELNWLANRVMFNNLARLNEKRTMTIVTMCRSGTSNRFVYSGQHEDLYIYRAQENQVELVQVDQIPHGLGMLDEFPNADFHEGRFALDHDDLLLIATDGIREAPRNGDYNQGMFGEERVKTLLARSKGVPLDTLKNELIHQLAEFTGGQFFDDVTFLMVRATVQKEPTPTPAPIAAAISES